MKSASVPESSAPSQSTTLRPVPAVAAIMVLDRKILLVRRGCEPSKGKWSIPGGSVEWGETLEEALKREAMEETGLEIRVGDVAGVSDLIVRADHDMQYHYVLIDYFAYPIGGMLRAGSDADDVRWVPVSGLDHYELSEHLRERLKEMGIGS